MENNTFNKPLVSICCLTYNHATFIVQAMDSFLMQRTIFPIEIIIHDDASTDNTADIIREYAVKDKRIITILQTENQYSKGINPAVKYLFPIARGKYIAACEGDDYWTDPFKLQKQVDFLEANPDYSISFHAAEHLDVNSGRKIIHRYKCKNGFRFFTAKDAIRKSGGFMTTNSMVFRTEFITHLPEWVINAPAGDFALSLLLASKGHIGYFDEIMSVYRRNVPGSMTSHFYCNLSNLSKLIKNTNKMLFGFNKYTKRKHMVLISISIIKNYIGYYKHFICSSGNFVMAKILQYTKKCS